MSIHLKVPNTVLIFILLSVIIVGISSCKTKEDIDLPEEVDLPQNLELIGLTPFELQIESISLTEKKLKWDFNYTNISGFKVDRKAGNNPWETAYLNSTKDQYYAIDNDIIPDSSITYHYRVYAWSGSSVSLFTAIEQNFGVNTPSNFIINHINEVKLKLSWEDNTIGETGFIIDKKIANSEWQIGYKKLGANENSFTDSIIDKSTDIYYRIYTTWNELISNKIQENAIIGLSAPQMRPTTQTSLSQSKLEWLDLSDGEQGFVIDRRIDGETWQYGYDTVSANTETYIDQNIACNSEINYRVYAFSGSTHSPYSYYTVLNFIYNINNLEVEMINLSDIRIRWSSLDVGLDGFRIDKKTSNSNWQENWKTVGADINECHDNSFPVFDNIQYRIFALFSDCLSEPDLEVINTDIPNISYLNLSLTNDNEIKLKWNSSVSGEDGFKIDRKIGDSNWEIAFASTEPNVHKYYDEAQFPLGEIIHYRVYSYFQENVSDFETNSIKYCTGSFVDSRDGQEYEVILIGEQCWMAENLNIGKRVYLPNGQSDNNIIEKYCYSNNESNCDTYGGLYIWDEIMKYQTDDITGICPEGWHVPTFEDFSDLKVFAGGTEIAGKRLKSRISWYDNGNGTDTYDFNALPGGHVSSNEFTGITKRARFPASRYYNNGDGYSYYMTYARDDLGSTRIYDGDAVSVRCVKD